MDDKSDKTSIKAPAKKKKKSRVVKIEELDSEKVAEIVRLKTAIEDLFNDIARFITPPAVALHNVVAKQHYNQIKDGIEELKIAVNSINNELRKATIRYDLDDQITILNQKKDLLTNMYIKLEPSISQLMELQDQAYPTKLDEAQFRKTNNEIVRSIQGMIELLKQKEEKGNRTEIGATILTKLSQLLSDFNVNDGARVIQIGKQYREKPSSFNAEQYAGIITARNNLRQVEEQFNLLLNTLDMKVAFEHKRNEVSKQANDLSLLYSELYNIRGTHSPLVVALRDVLYNQMGNPKTSFQKEDFTLTLRDPLPSAEQFEAKAEEVNAAHQALVKLITEHQSNFDPKLKKDIKILSSRTKIFAALSQGKSVDFGQMNQALELDFSSATISDNLIYLRQLINFDQKKVNENIEINRGLYDDFLINFPEVSIERDKLIIDGNYYPLSSAKDFGYSTARTLMLEAIQKGDQPNQDYKAIYATIVTARDSLDSYMKLQNELSKPRQDLDGLILKLEEKIKVMNPSPNREQFNKQYEFILSSVNKLKNHLTQENLKDTMGSLKKWNEQFNQYEFLQKTFKDESKKINKIDQFFSGLLLSIEQEQTRISKKYNESEPRIALLKEIEFSVKSKIDTFNTLSKRLVQVLDNIEDPKVAQTNLSNMSSEIKKANEELITNIQDILTDKKLEHLTLATKNPFLVWITKLIRPLLSLMNKDNPEQKPGFFMSKTEVTLKALRESTKEVKTQGQDVENIDPKSNHS